VTGEIQGRGAQSKKGAYVNWRNEGGGNGNGRSWSNYLSYFRQLRKGLEERAKPSGRKITYRDCCTAYATIIKIREEVARNGSRHPGEKP